jgi:hypothetical protein
MQRIGDKHAGVNGFQLLFCEHHPQPQAGRGEAGGRVDHVVDRHSTTSELGADAGQLERRQHAAEDLQTLPAPEIEHLSSISTENAEYAAVAATPGGPLVAVAPFGPDRGQLAVIADFLVQMTSKEEEMSSEQA